MAARRKPTPPSDAAVPTGSAVMLRGRLWIEFAGAAGLTEAGADLLEQIEASGSLSQAARRLRFSYRRAWMLLDAMNRRWPSPLVRTTTGGHKGGGAVLTEEGRNVLHAYRDLQVRFEHFLDLAAGDFRQAVR